MPRHCLLLNEDSNPVSASSYQSCCNMRIICTGTTAIYKCCYRVSYGQIPRVAILGRKSVLYWVMHSNLQPAIYSLLITSFITICDTGQVFFFSLFTSIVAISYLFITYYIIVYYSTDRQLFYWIYCFKLNSSFDFVCIFGMNIKICDQ